MSLESNLRINWLIAVVITGWLFYLLAPVLTPFVAAALLAYLGDPLADRLQKLKLPRSVAVIAVFLTGAGPSAAWRIPLPRPGAAR